MSTVTVVSVEALFLTVMWGDSQNSELEMKQQPKFVPSGGMAQSYSDLGTE